MWIGLWLFVACGGWQERQSSKMILYIKIQKEDAVVRIYNGITTITLHRHRHGEYEKKCKIRSFRTNFLWNWLYMSYLRIEKKSIFHSHSTTFQYFSHRICNEQFSSLCWFYSYFIIQGYLCQIFYERCYDIFGKCFFFLFKKGGKVKIKWRKLWSKCK